MNYDEIIVFGSNSYFCRNFCYYIKLIKKWNVRLIGYDMETNNKNPWLNEFKCVDLSHDLNDDFNNKIIINFASLSHVDKSFEQPDYVMKNNVGIAHTLKGLSPKLGIHISTDEVELASNPYSKSKKQQEEILNETSWIIIRFNNLYGCFNLNCLPTQPILWNNLIHYNGVLKVVKSFNIIKRNWLPVGVACEYILGSVSNNQKLCKCYSGYPLTVAEFIKEYVKKYNVSLKVIEIPDRQITDYEYELINPIEYETFLKWL